MTIQDAFNIAAQRHREGRLAEAESIYRQILQQVPNHADSLHLLGMLAVQAGHADAAIELIDKAIAENPASADYHNTRALTLKSLNRNDDAIAAYQTAIKLNPNLVEAHSNLGNMMLARGEYAEAAKYFNRALEIQPDFSDAIYNLGNLEKACGRFDAAISLYQRALALRPQWPAALNNMGVAYRSMEQLDLAQECFARAIQISPQFAEGMNNLADTFFQQGKVQEAIGIFNRALAAGPNAPIAGNRVFVQQFHPDIDAHANLRAARAFNEQYARSLTTAGPRPRSNEGRRLRVGYLSSHFRDHVLRLYLLPLMANHNYDRFEVFCYCDTHATDRHTEKIKAFPDHWRNTAALGDEALADLICSDQLDILMDGNMLMAPARPLVLARKPAPVQVAWLAYPGTTGLSAMDYRLTDPYLDPPGAFDDCYSEKSIRVGDTFWCFDPDEEGTPRPAVDPPVTRTGNITFGCLNSFGKINAGTLRLWSRVLRAVPNSRLLLLAPGGEARRWSGQLLQAEGIAADRIEFVPFQPRNAYLSEYNRIDICLDTLPYNGHTTSLDAMWMGVPVVTRVGSTIVGRGGLSQLSNLKLTELVGRDDEQFVKIATELAGDLPRLTELHRTLRQRMIASPLMDAPLFARNIEAAYLEMARLALHDASE